MVIKIHLEHRRCPARAEAFYERNSETAVGGSLAGLYPQFATNMFGNTRLAQDLARECLTDLNVILTDRFGIDHRIERRYFPDVGNPEVQPVREIEHARRIQIAAFALHNKHKRQDRGTLEWILCQM